jgi:hypothetical protein
MDFACPSSFFYCIKFLLFSFDPCCSINKLTSVVSHIRPRSRQTYVLVMFGWRIYDGLFVVADRSLGVGGKLFTM